MTNPLRLFPAEDETIAGTGRALREGRATCRGVLERCLQKIDVWEPSVRAWVVIDRDRAVAEADRLDRELSAGDVRGPLHGIPVGVKDIIDVAGLPSACGARRWATGPAASDAPLVARLRSAGAVILGKTVTTPYAWVDPPVTRNPWDLGRTPGGSSSGSAAAVACGMCLGALGTQTGGSITRPASFCGVAGYKPHYLELESDGILPFAPSLDHPGPLARAVGDLRLLYSALRRPASLGRGAEPPAAYAPLKRQALAQRPTPPASARPRVGRVGGPFATRAEPAMRSAMDRAFAAFAAAGAEVGEAPLPVELDEAIAAHRTIMAAEAAAFHGTRIAAEPDDYPPRISALVTEGMAIPATQYVRAQEWLWESRNRVTACFAHVDVLAVPAAPGVAPGPDTTGNPVFNSPWSLWGLPTVTFPIGLSDEGLPLGIQLVGSDLRFKSRALFAAALWCEDVIRRGYESRTS